MSKRVFIFSWNAGQFFFPWINKTNADFYKNPFAPLADDALETILQSYDIVLLWDWPRAALLYHPAFLAEHRARSYVYFWDHVPAHTDIKKIKEYHTGVYSFQRNDCETYGLSFNSTVYAPPPAWPREEEILYDLVFVGGDKNRLQKIRSIHEACRRQGLRSKVHVRRTPGTQEPNERLEDWEISSQSLPYAGVYIQLVRRSRAILDLCQAGQTGYSLRVMEHIFFDKKLVTDNPVIKRSGFYHPDNIFLIEEDDIEELKPWLDLPFAPIAQDIKEYYTFERWIERFA